jgi:hypothetical protein
MTTVENVEFTCHVCGTSFTNLVVQSTYTRLPTPKLDWPVCPYCGEPARSGYAYQPGRILDLFLKFAAGATNDPREVEYFASHMTRAEDIDAWREGLAKVRWERLLEDSLRRTLDTIERESAAIRSAEPFGGYGQLQFDAGRIEGASDAMRLFAATPTPDFVSWPQMNRDVRTMLDADPRLEQGALETIAHTWGGSADRHRAALAAWRDGSLRPRVEAFFDAVERRYAEQLDAVKQRIAAEGKPLPPPLKWRMLRRRSGES